MPTPVEGLHSASHRTNRGAWQGASNTSCDERRREERQPCEHPLRHRRRNDLPIDTVQLCEKTTGGLVIDRYGRIETSPMAIGNPMGPVRRPGAIGVPYLSREIRVVDSDDTVIVGACNEEGGLLMQGPLVFGR